MTLETKHFAITDLKADDETRTVEGFASVFNTEDSYRDIVVPGAFTRTLKENGRPAMLWQHDTRQVIGTWDELEETPKSLRVKGTILDTTLGTDVYKIVRAKAVTGMSIGYGTKKYEIDEKKGTRRLLDVDLFEVSLVTFPANDKAQITRVKAAPRTIRELEEYLREGGFSQKDATTVALHGYKALTTRGEPDEEVTAQLAAAETRLAALFNQFTA
jgi:hypothetical protein